MSLFFNMLSRSFIAFLARSKRPLISWLQSPYTVILEPKKIKFVTFSIVLPLICCEVMGPDAMILVFWMLSFMPTFSLSSFNFTTRLFSSSLLSAIRVVSSAYLRLLIFLPAILIPIYASSSLAFHMKYPANKLNKQDDNIQPWHTPFSILNQFVVPCPVLTCFLTCIHVSPEAGKVVWCSISLRIFPNLLWFTQSKALAQSVKQMWTFFLEFSCFFFYSMDFGH